MTNKEKLAAELCWGCIPFKGDSVYESEKYKDMLSNIDYWIKELKLDIRC